MIGDIKADIQSYKQKLGIKDHAPVMQGEENRIPYQRIANQRATEYNKFDEELIANQLEFF